MTSRERVLISLQHKEPDCVPFDFNSTGATGISLKAYKNLLNHLVLKSKVSILDFPAQRASVDEILLQRLKVDTKGIYPNAPIQWKVSVKEDGDYDYYEDGWGIIRRKPKTGGLYYDIIGHPLSNISTPNIERYSWPDPTNSIIFQGVKEKTTRLYTETDKFLVLGRTFANGIFTMGAWLEGFEKWFCDLISEPKRVSKIMDKVLELKIKYWERILAEVGNYINAIVEYDDLGTQQGLLISPQLYRKYVKPRQKELFRFIKKRSPAYIFFHTDGSVYDIIPDLIEIGVDILNPIQIGTAKMDANALKAEFGNYLTFWGGGIDTQKTLPCGTPKQVKDEVKRRIKDLSPGGGFVFASVHSIQADVPPENIMAMWEALQENSVYEQ